MENFTTDAINIKTYPLSEHDNIVLMFSREGLIKCVAKGVKKPKSKLGARMQLLVANKLLLHKGKNMDTICQAQAINTFNKLRYDFDKLTYGMYIGELVSVFARENSNSEKIYDIFYKALENISEANSKEQILLNVLKFQLKFMQVLGYGMELKKCIACGHEVDQDALLSIDEGGILCKDCSHKYINKISVPKKIREFLIELSKREIDEETKYDSLVNEKVCTTCFNLLKRYIGKRTNLPIKTAKVLEEQFV